MPSVEIEVNWGTETPIAVPATATNQQIIYGGGRLTGWSLMESTGAAPASCKITSGGNLVAVIGLGQGLSSTSHLGDLGIHCAQDITLTVLTGSVEGAIYIRAPR